MRQLSSSAPYSVLAEAAEKLEATRLEINSEEVRTEALKVLHDTVEQSRSEAFASIPEEVGETATSIQLDARCLRSMDSSPERLLHFPAPRPHSDALKDVTDMTEKGTCANMKLA